MGKNIFTKRLLPMALTAAMVFTSVPVLAAPNDLSGHWAEKVMTEWQEKGLIKGYEDGTVKPDNAVSRAEFVVMMNNALGLKADGKVSFSDVTEADWYYNAVATAVEVGYCKGYDDGTFKPGATITRAEAAIMIANAADLTADAAGADVFADAAAIPVWAKGSVGAVVEAGFMSGYPDGTFGAAASIKRAEAVSSLNRVMGNGTAAVVVTKDEEVIENQVIEGDLLIDETVGEGEVYLKNVEIKGDLLVNGGGSDSVYMHNVKVHGDMRVNKHGVHVHMTGDTEASKIIMEKAASLTADDTFTGEVEQIKITEELNTEDSVEIAVPAKEIVVEGKANVAVKADAGTVVIEEKAAGSIVEVAETAKVDKVTANAETVVTGKGEVGKLEANVSDVTVNSNVTVEETETAPNVTEPTVTDKTPDATTNTGGGSGGGGGGGSSAKAAVTDKVDLIEIDLSASDEWRTEGYVYDLFDVSFNGAVFAVEDFDWNEVTFWVNNERFIWDPETSKPGDFAVETDFLDYSYDPETETGHATGLVAAYVDNVKAGETYEVEIRFPSDYLRVTSSNYAIKSGDTFTIDFDVNITDSKVELSSAKDKLDTITIDVGEADDWRTEGYVYVEKEITFDGAEWVMEPYWDHVTFWIDDEQFVWTDESVPGEYKVEVDMFPEWDEQGNLTMKAMVFAYVENVEDGDSFDMEIRVPTYCLERTDDDYRITRDETAVIDFTVEIEGCDDYVPPVVDRVEDVYIDLSASDDWRTEGYLYQMFDITFNAAEFAVEDLDWDNVTYWVNGERFIWGEDSEPGDFAVEADVFYYDGESGYALGLIAAYVDNVAVDEMYEVEIQFPSDHLRVTDNDYAIKSGDTFTVSFNVYIVDSEEELEPAKDELDEITIDLTTADEWLTEGYVYVEEEITFDAAEWFMEPYWDAQHVTYWIDGEQFQWIPGVSVVGEYDVEVDMAPEWDEQGNLSMKAMVFAYVDNVEDGDSFDMEIRVPTYCLERTDDDYRITRDDTAVIDFTVNIVESVVIPEDAFSAEVFATRVDCNDNGTVVEEGGSIVAEFTFENYTEPVTFGLMDHDNNEYVAKTATFTRANADDTEGSVTFDMTGAPVANYEVVYYLADLDTWKGTDEYIDLTETDEPVAEVNFTLNEDFTATWNGVEGYNGYRIDIGDNIIWAMDGTTKANNLLSFIPCADEDTTYDIVLNGLDEEYHATELARLEDALKVTVSGSAVEYTAEFGETSVNVTWTANGIGEIHEVRNSDGALLSVGGGSVTPTLIIHYNNNYTAADGDVLDLRVVTDVSLDGQVLSATITPASETEYVVEGEDEPETEEMTVTVKLSTDTVVTTTTTSPVVEFVIDNLTENTTVSAYVVDVEDASEDVAIELKTQDVPAGTKYTGIVLYTATFDEAGTYYVYYKVGDGDWCETPLIIEAIAPEE